MIVAQITDLHIGFDGPDAPCKNTARLKLALKELLSQSVKPDLLLITGDLVENAENWAYENLRKLLQTLNIPYYLAMGNHDDREAFLKHFPETKINDGFVQYTIEGHPLRIIVLDTLKPGYHGGGFCERRAEWLSKQDAPWVKRLKGVLDKHDNVVQIISGHIHRRITQKFSTSIVSVSGAIAPQVKLDLAPLAPDTPDGRTLLVEGPVEYCLHQWNGHVLTSHAALAPQGRPIVHFDEAHAFIVPHTLDLAKK